MSICKQTVKKFCKEFENIENYREALNSPEKWDCHHRLEDTGLSKKDLINKDMYYNRPASELIFLTHRTHVSLHQKGKNNNMHGIHRYGSTAPRYKFICPIKLTYMYCKQKMSAIAIAEELGVGKNTIRRHLRELNTPIRKR